jgi:RNA polymerase sigma-70 factor (ECF subfamily)
VVAHRSLLSSALESHRSGRRYAPEYSRRVSDLLTDDDTQAVRALKARSESAFAALVRMHHASMLRVAQIYVSSRAVAEEVVQETWVAVLNGIDRFEGRSSLKTWIYRILGNIAKTRAIREGRTLPFSALDPGRVPEAAVDPDRFRDSEHPRWPGHWASPPQRWDTIPEERLLGRETKAKIEAALEQLPASQRAVVSLRDIEGWSSDEVCNALELSETNQRVLLHRGRSKLRTALESYLEGEVA